jgi:long-chain fatty acid transport protein
MTARKTRARRRPARARGSLGALAAAAIGATGALGACVIAPSDAHAAGLYFSDRGVRPLGRGGAFVAGADDFNATWYNPAGLADAGSSFLLDSSWLNFSSTFARQTNVPSAGGTVYTDSFPTVSGSTKFLPVPTIGGTLAVGPVTLALGAFAPYTAVASYPLTLSDGTTPSPSRYSLVSLDGSALVVTGLWAAYKPVKWLRLGLGVEALVGNFDSTVVFSACPPQSLVCAAEDPQYDAFSQLKVGPIFSPSGNAGITVVPERHIRIGLSGQLPFSIDAPATVTVKLPNAPEFDSASQQGTNAHVKFNLPGVFRAGVEGRFDLGPGAMRIEGTYEREFWSDHQSIDIVPDNITLVGIKGFPSPFAVSPISIPRGFQDSNSVRLGAEYSFMLAGYGLDVRTGVNYETSAIQTAYLSPLTVDMDKVFLGFGGSLHLATHWRLDALYGHVFASSVYVNPATAAVPKVNPVQGNAAPSETVNGGTYTAKADILGVGLNYKF